MSVVVGSTYGFIDFDIDIFTRSDAGSCGRSTDGNSLGDGGSSKSNNNSEELHDVRREKQKGGLEAEVRSKRVWKKVKRWKCRFWRFNQGFVWTLYSPLETDIRCNTKEGKVCDPV